MAELTWFEFNTWKLDLGGYTILIDPWLVGDLVFGNMPWLIRGVRPEPISIPDSVDLILLSQGLEDHAHPATLQALDKAIPIVASPSGAAVAKKLGFGSVTALNHGETLELDELTIQAFPEAVVGPMKRENGYLLQLKQTNKRLYYGPHGYPSELLKALDPVDVAISPVADLSLPLVGPIIRGKQGGQEVAQWLNPAWMIPTATAVNVEYTGLIARWQTLSGSADELRSHIQQQGLHTQVMDEFPPLKPVSLDFLGHPLAI